MNRIWIAVIVLIAVLVVARLRGRRKTRRLTAPRPGPRVTGFQVVTYVHPRMSRACLFDHGTQFGRGFRRKEGPTLPHDGNCRCEAKAFNFSSGEVFDGALRRVGELQSSIPGLEPESVQGLIEALKRTESNTLPGTEQAYLEAVDAGRLPGEYQGALREFLVERYAYLREQGTSNSPPDASGAPTTEEPETA